MPRINTNVQTVSQLRKYRMNTGLTAREFAIKAGMGYNSVLNIEAGKEISRMLASKYLASLGFSLNKPESLPQGVKIVDVGEAVRLLSEQ